MYTYMSYFEQYEDIFLQEKITHFQYKDKDRLI